MKSNEGEEYGDPFIRYIAPSGTTSYAIGTDTSDGNKLKISYAASTTAVLGTNDFITIISDGGVGIGTSSPVGGVYKLQLDNTTSTDTRLNIKSTSADPAITLTTVGFDRDWGMGIDFSDNSYLKWGTNPTVGAATKMTLTENARLGIGSHTPTATLHLQAGAAAASSGPLKFITGTLLTTAEAGTIEYTTPGLYFTNGTVQRQGIVLSRQAVITTNQTRTSTTALTNITGLDSLGSLKAGFKYRFEAKLYTTSNSAGGVKVDVYYNGGAVTTFRSELELRQGTATTTRVQNAATPATATTGATAVTTASIIITGYIVPNSDNSLTIRGAQNASNVNATTFLVGSYLKVEQVN